jgi:glycosyltransferase involved in cell wall biosynthesis
MQQVLDNVQIDSCAPPQRGMLLVLPVPFRWQDNQLWIETQAFNGLERWADNFGSIIVAAPLIPEPLATQDKTMTWRSAATLPQADRFELVPLPWAYSIGPFLRHYGSIRATLTHLIGRSRYLQFAIGGLIGDWAAIAALEARKQGRAYAVHADRVEHEVVLRTHQASPWSKRFKTNILSSLMKHYHRWIIQQADLGLWHGDDCYTTYHSLCPHSYRIHNIHTKPADSISATALVAKVEQVMAGSTLEICYAGRMEPMKAPLDWVHAIAKARDLGANIHAVWLGDGSLRDQMQATIHRLELDNCITLAGFERDRAQLLTMIQQSHLMLFTHITPESPRCLIEAMVCGTPIVGYHSNYAEDLVKEFGGGAFVPIQNWQQLGDLLVKLSKNRKYLAQLIQEAAANGARFNDCAVFRERNELIKKHLS